MTKDETDIPEASYRRGYQQGAFDLAEALEQQSMAMPIAIRRWIDRSLYDWCHYRSLDRLREPPVPPGRGRGY